MTSTHHDDELSSNASETMRHILICVAGLTPQVITETLYVLTQVRGERVDEIRVITTFDGYDKIMTGVVNGHGKPEQSLLHPEKGQFYAFCRDYGISHQSILFDKTSIVILAAPDKRTLEDIRTIEENKYAGDQICEIIRELTKDANVRLHASAAGGRKTMGIYLTAAMQLFGRAQDTLSHVLVSDDFESSDFYYIPPAQRIFKTRDGREVSTSEAKIYLADIPFIRLRGSGSDWLRVGDRSYGSAVHQAQENLDLAESAHDLHINSRNRTVTVGARHVKLSKREFFFYLLFVHFCRLKREGRQNNFVALNDIARADLDAVFKRLTTGVDVAPRAATDYQLVAGYDFLENLIAWVDEDFISPEFQDTFLQVKAKINRRIEDAALPERCAIATRGERGASRYGLDFSPERISLA